MASFWKSSEEVRSSLLVTWLTARPVRDSIHEMRVNWLPSVYERALMFSVYICVCVRRRSGRLFRQPGRHQGHAGAVRQAAGVADVPGHCGGQGAAEDHEGQEADTARAPMARWGRRLCHGDDTYQWRQDRHSHTAWAVSLFLMMHHHHPSSSSLKWILYG